MKRQKPQARAITPRALEVLVDGYFDSCAALEVFPDRAGLLLALRLPLSVCRQYEINEDGRFDPYAEIMHRARLRRETWLARAMFTDKNKVQSAIFHLKQPANGGYCDKQEETGAIRFQLTIGDGDSTLLD